MRRHAAALLLLVPCACASEPLHPRSFSTTWIDDGGASIAAVYAERRGTIPEGANVVVGVAGSSDALMGLVLDTGARWSHKHPIDTRPVVAGAVVLVVGKGELLALDARAGAKLWSRPVGRVALFGAGDDGRTTVVSMSAGAHAGGTLLFVARNGAVHRQLETDQPNGVPAVAYGTVFVPWANRWVSALDLVSGEEVGRVVLPGGVSRAFTRQGALYFGDPAFTRFDERIPGASRGLASHAGIPTYDATETTTRRRIFARPAGPGGPMDLDAGRFYATEEREVSGLEAHTGRAVWLRHHDADVVGGDAARSGLVLCDDRGVVTLLDGAHGEVIREIDLGARVRACVVSVDALSVR